MNDGMKQAYIDKTSAQLQEWGAKVELVKAKIAKESAGMQLEYHAKMEKWNEKESVFKKKIEELKEVGEQGYESLKTGVQAIWSDMTNIMKTIEEKNNEK